MSEEKKERTPQVTGKINYSKPQSEELVREIYNYLSQNGDINKFITSQYVSRLGDGFGEEEAKKRVEHPDLTNYLLEHERHWKAIQSIYKNHELFLNQKHAITKNETILAKKERISDLIH